MEYVISKAGSVYHSPDCPYIQSVSTRPISEGERNYFSPCKKCIPSQLPCGCKINWFTIEYCPKHGAAPQMHWDKARKALRKVEGK